jgi:hypothetical protein
MASCIQRLRSERDLLIGIEPSRNHSWIPGRIGHSVVAGLRSNLNAHSSTCIFAQLGPRISRAQPRMMQLLWGMRSTGISGGTHEGIGDAIKV